jgi:phage gp36-like protein
MYCALVDILAEIDRSVLVDLSDDADEPTGDIVEANITSAIERAGAIIDGYLAHRMLVPTEATATIKALCVDIAIYTLMSRRENVTKVRGDRFGAAMNFLKSVVEGKATIGVTTDITSRYAIYSAPDADFGTGTWEQY